MKIKPIAIGFVSTLLGYGLGQVIGCIKTCKQFVDAGDEAWPGLKKYMVEELSKEVGNRIFKTK